MENTVREALTNVNVMEQNYSKGTEILLKQSGMNNLFKQSHSVAQPGNESGASIYIV